MKFLILYFSVILSSFFPNHGSNEKITHYMDIHVNDSNGNPVNYAKIGFDVCESLTCLGGKSDLRTDKEGFVRLEWTHNCQICIIYVNGKAHKGTYKEDNSYSFVAE